MQSTMIKNDSNISCSVLHPYIADISFENYVYFSILCLIFILGLLGNIILIFIIITRKRMRTLPNFLIINLAIGDSIFLVAHALSTLPMYVFSKFHANNALCKLDGFSRYFTLGISIFTLMFLAIDR